MTKLTHFSIPTFILRDLSNRDEVLVSCLKEHTRVVEVGANVTEVKLIVFFEIQGFK